MLNAYIYYISLYYIYGALAIGKTLGDDLRVARVVVRWCIGRKLCYYWCDRSLTAELPQMTRAGPHIPHRFSGTSTTFSPPLFFFCSFSLASPSFVLCSPSLLAFFLLLHPSPCRLSFSFIPQIEKLFELNCSFQTHFLRIWFGHILLCLCFSFYQNLLLQLFSSSFPHGLLWS